uniref:Ciliary neurotrophic factor n=1 Tax=Oreochromis niloticus TaxID=8128 RepID=A0A669BYL5_ORENI
GPKAASAASHSTFKYSGTTNKPRKKENFTEDVADRRMVSVPPPSSQLDTRDKLWRIHSALLQCQKLLEKAVAKEEEELGGGKKGEYENKRKLVKERLPLLILSTGELLKAAEGTTSLTPSVEGLEVGPDLNVPTNLFDLKLWVYRVYKEVNYWSKTATNTLKDLPSVIVKERARTTRARNRRSTRR